MKANQLIPLFIHFIFFSLIFSVQGLAQTIEEDVVYLNDGSIIRGEITERVIGDQLKIEILGGSVFVFQESEIEKITREPKKMLQYGGALPSQTSSQPYFSYEARRAVRKAKPITGRSRGIYNIFSFGFQPGRDAWGIVVPWPTLNYRTGYSLSPKLNIGLGIGLDPYAAGGTFPLYADLHGDLGVPKQVMPHYFVQAGYGFAGWTNWRFRNFEGGPMAHIGGGWKLNTRRNSEWIFTLGLNFRVPLSRKIQDGIHGREILLSQALVSVFSTVP